MPLFKLDKRLANDCYIFAENDQNILLLMDNAAVPWFILVPKVEVVEWTDMIEADERKLRQDINWLASFLKQHFSVDKLNIAGIGNVVSQLHIHVIGRHKEDYCWPNVIWGTTAPASYETQAINKIWGLLATQSDLPFRMIPRELIEIPGSA